MQVWNVRVTSSLLRFRNSHLKSSRRFMGAVEVPLASTLPSAQSPSAEPRWYHLVRRQGADAVQGQVQLSFVWQFTAEGLLQIEVSALENMLEQKLEVLAMLQPVHHSLVASWIGPTADRAAPESPRSARAAAASGSKLSAGSPRHSAGSVDSWKISAAVAQGSPSAVTDQEGASGESGAESVGGDPLKPLGTGNQAPWRPAALEALAASGDSLAVEMEITVLEARNVVPRSGVGLALGALVPAGSEGDLMGGRHLPRALVKVKVNNDKQRVEATSDSINPRFPAQKLLFSGVPLRSIVQVEVYDGKPRRPVLLGDLSMAVPAFLGTDPVYVWLPLKATHQARFGQRKKPLQPLARQLDHKSAEPLLLYARIRITKPQVFTSTEIILETERDWFCLVELNIWMLAGT